MSRKTCKTNRQFVEGRGISKGFGGNQLFKDISFKLDHGEVIVLRGENGSGKTTLLNILGGGLAPDRGELKIFDNKCLHSFSWPLSWGARLSPFWRFTPERLSRAGVGRAWQDIRLFKTFSLLDNVAVASPHQVGENPVMALCRGAFVRGQERNNRENALGLLEEFGLSGRENSTCERLSLGQMKRAAIARLIQSGAKVLLLDEPLAGLDHEGRRDILQFVRKLASSNQFTLVLVEHVLNLPEVLDLASKVWTLEDGLLKFETVRDVKKELAETNSARAFLNDIKDVSYYSNADGSEPALLSIADLSLKRGYRPVLDGLSLGVPANCLAGLAKPNGWGKTTLLESIMGLLSVDTGRLIFNGKDITKLEAWRRAREGISLLRSTNNVVSGLTVGEHLNLSQQEDTIVSVYDEWRVLLPDPNRRADSLSGGERQRLAIGCLPLRSLLLLDEPFLALDRRASDTLVSILNKLENSVLLAMPTSRRAAEGVIGKAGV
jgi:branched-chain amino acid transport system ATP-binding protein